MNKMNKKKIKKAAKKIEENENIWFEYGHPADGYIAVAGWDYDYDTGEKVYGISYHKGQMPAFNTRGFDTIEELAVHCLELQPDLRRWHTKFDV